MMRIRLFGELAVDLDGERRALPASRKACAVFAWLAAHPGAHLRSRLAAEFWPDVLDTSARASLRSAIWALRAQIGETDHLRTDRDSVELSGLTVDLHEFDCLVAEGRAEDAERLCRAELLHRFDAEWVLDLREDYEGRRAEVLGELARRAEAAGDLAKAVDWARQRSALRPLDETAGREVIRLLTGTGERSAALAAYTRLAGRLRTELNVLPSKETVQLVDSEETEPVAGRLVGRDKEIADLLCVWHRAETGLGASVAISGDGGIGKSRLAEELLTTATQAGALVAVGTATVLGGATPFGPWTDVITDLVSEIDLPPDRQWPAELARVVPSIGLPGTRSTEPGFDRVRFFEAVVELIGWACRDRPLALLVEDLQLADVSSVELAAHVGRRITRLPVVLVLTRRRLPPRPDVDAVVGALRARGALAADLELAPLSPSAVGQLVIAALPDSSVAHIVTLADGNR